MTTIGGAWIKSKEGKDGNRTYYYSCAFDEAIFPFTLDKNKRLILKENKNKKDNEKAPDMIIEAYIPKPKTREKEMITDEENPF